MSTILERNVRALLRRSYVPALPAPHYRDRLESLFLSEFERHFERQRTRRAARISSWPRIAVAVAAALLALLIGWRLFPTSTPERASKERLLAHGEVALGLPLGWRAADGQERTHGLQFSAPSLTVATPAQATLDVLVSAGAVHVLADSEIALERRADGDFAALRKGQAWFQSGDQRTALVTGLERALRTAPAANDASLAATDARTNARKALERAPETPAVTPAAHVLAGTVVDAESGAAIDAFTVALLRERTGNETRPPVLRAFPAQNVGVPGSFRWENPPAGKYRVFVYAEGYALSALGEFELAGALPSLQAELVRGTAVKGLVLDTDGAPLADALVLSEQDTPTDGLFFADTERFFWLPIQTHTGPDGHFELAHLTSGRHTLRASAVDHAPSWLETSVPARADLAVNRAESTDELNFTLSAGGIVTGTVKRDDGGPWAEAEMVVVAMDQAQRARTNFALTRTDAEGRYRVDHLPPITMIVVLIRADERPDVRPVQIEEGLTVTADFGPPVHGLRLAGRVLRADGTPLAHQNIGLFERTNASWNQDWVASTTQPDGAFVFEGVQPGAYLIFLIDEMGRGLRCVDELELAAGVSALEHDVHVQGGGIAVTARDGRPNAGRGADTPLESAALMLERVEPDGGSLFNAFGLSDAHGQFDFVDLRPGTYRVTVYPGGAGLGFVESEPLTLAAGEHTALTLAAEEGGAVDVLVRDTDGKPLEHAAVAFTDERGHEHNFSRLPFTDANGRYRANGLRPGRYRVAAQRAGFQGTPTAFRFELGRELEIPVVLMPMLAR